MRRSVTIDDDVYKQIQERRGKIMMDTGKDANFSSMLNTILREGLKKE